MDINAVNNAIQELENSDTTIKNINELAALYTVRNNYAATDTEDQLNDILPAYRDYCKTKRKYQLGQYTESYVLSALQDTCKEIYEFIDTMYTYTDMTSERKYIQSLIMSLQEIIKRV